MRINSLETVLIAVIMTCIAMLILNLSTHAQESQDMKQQAVKLRDDSTSTPEHLFVVTYFHSNKRCKSCKLIESMSHDVITKDFAAMLGDGKLEWRTINVSQKENKDYVDKYELFAQAVVISEIVNGEEVRWKNLDQVWKLLRKPDDFYAYVKDELQIFIQGE